MMKFDFDAELTGTEGHALPVYCEVELPYVGGQKARIQVALPAGHIAEEPPDNPCEITGNSGAFTFRMQGVHWRRFPTSSKNKLGLGTVELLHIDRLTIRQPPISTRREIRFHLPPISFFRKESSFVLFGSDSNPKELFSLDLPGLGVASFVSEWVTIFHRDAEIPGATVIAGFSAVISLDEARKVDVNELVTKFKSSLDVLSVLFRQAVSLHGWTYTDEQTVSTWIAPLSPNVTPSAQEDRGDFVAQPQFFSECATQLARSFEEADTKTRSLVRHLSLAVNPHNNLRSGDHFLLMFSAFERMIDSAWKQDKTPDGPSVTTQAVIGHLETMQGAVIAKGGEGALEITARLGGLVNVMNRPSVQDKVKALLRVYPAMDYYSRDLWPILGTEKMRGLREVRNALAHGGGSFVSVDVVAVANWHLSIMLERAIFVLLKMPIPAGIVPRSYLLHFGGKGWYERDWWEPLRTKPDVQI